MGENPGGAQEPGERQVLSSRGAELRRRGSQDEFVIGPEPAGAAVPLELRRAVDRAAGPVGVPAIPEISDEIVVGAEAQRPRGGAAGERIEPFHQHVGAQVGDRPHALAGGVGERKLNVRRQGALGVLLDIAPHQRRNRPAGALHHRDHRG